MKRRPFKSGILNHCYQRSADHGLIFYSQSDYLVWFTIVCVTAPRYGVKILGLCPMPDHTHMAVVADTVKDLSGFMGAVNRSFSKMHNETCGLKGSWFESPFGSVPKQGNKQGRNCLIYVGNNPVERQLSVTAAEFRWTFLAYAVSNHPFSEKLVLRKASWNMRNAVREVRAQYKAGKPLRYNLLKRLVKKLNSQEIQQLTDFIINTYNVIDYHEALRFFDGRFEKMTAAMSLSTAKEFDLNETFVGWSDKPYAPMAQLLLKEKELPDIHNFLSWPREEKRNLYQLLKRKTDFMPEQISKFLHYWP